MLAINITLIIQLFHFIIAYCLMRFLLFEPILKIIYAQDKLHHDLADQVEKRERIVTRKEHEKKKIWHTFQQFFMRNVPIIAHQQPADTQEVPSISPLDFDKKTVSEQQTNLEKIIFKQATMISQGNKDV